MGRNKEKNIAMRKKTYQKILEAAAYTFANIGYQNCKVTDIAKHAGISYGNIYWYFKGKKELLKKILEREINSLKNIFQAALNYSKKGNEQLNILIDRYIKYCSKTKHFPIILISLLSTQKKISLKKLGFDMQEIGKQFHELFFKIISNINNQNKKMDKHISAIFFFSLIHGMVITYGNDFSLIPAIEIKKGLLRLLKA